MNNQELFELRKKRVLTFGNPDDLKDFLDNLIIEQVKFPLVVGYKDFNPDKEWRVRELTPQTINDELTLRNYLEGLREVNESFKQDKSAPELLTPNFLSILVYNGLDGNDRTYQHQKIFGVQIGFTNSSRNRNLESYSLSLYNRGLDYYSRTEKNKSDLSKIMEVHLGPK